MSKLIYCICLCYTSGHKIYIRIVMNRKLDANKCSLISINENIVKAKVTFPDENGNDFRIKLNGCVQAQFFSTFHTQNQ